MPRTLHFLGYVLVFSFFLHGCAYFKKGAPAKKTQTPSKQQGTPVRKTTQVQPKPAADPAAQQRYYDLGLKYYTEEDYLEAKKAWQQAVQYGPATPLAGKAREYLKKTEQVLKTLEEMERK